MSGQEGQGGLAGAGQLATAGRKTSPLVPWANTLGQLLQHHLALEIEERRLPLWLPALAGLGIILYFDADAEPVFWYAPLFGLFSANLQWATRNHRLASGVFAALAVLALGFSSAQWRSQSVKAPILQHIIVANLTGFVEKLDIRPNGARFVLGVASTEELAPNLAPKRVRLTMRGTPQFAAGDFISVRARLLPPSSSVIPGGYNFARDAYFMGLGAVGSVLGRPESFAPPYSASFKLAFMAQIDQARNRLAIRVNQVIGGEAGAIAAAMVTGKRDLLSQSTRELIREAGIFHIITISGIQMSLVAGILFWFIRRLLALSPTLALNYPIKKWAAASAMIFACLYDIGTGSRVGTERALVMTLVLFLAIMTDRAALTMRNLAIAAWAVILLEPDAILGASFQLSFAAVAALVAVHEARQRKMTQAIELQPQIQPNPKRHGQTISPSRIGEALRSRFQHLVGERTPAILLSTLGATSATAPFMAYDFHELSLYVMVGNPLTLGIIELFAIPGALLGALLYPIGLDAPIWHYVGIGIGLVLWVARHIAAAPGASVAIPAFSPLALAFLTLGLLSAVIWRTWIWRATAIPLFLIGIILVPWHISDDLLIPPSGDFLAFRASNGHLALLGKRKNNFAFEQWLRADGDNRLPETIIPTNDKDGGCDLLGCAATFMHGHKVALVLKDDAFTHDCVNADIIVTPLFAPRTCAALTFDRAYLTASGAVALHFSVKAPDITQARAQYENRPWSPLAPRWAKVTRQRPQQPLANALEDTDMNPVQP